MERLAGRTVLITGGASGIGLATARASRSAGLEPALAGGPGGPAASGPCTGPEL